MAKPKTKYGHMRDQLPALDHTPGESANGMLRIAELKSEITETSTTELARRWYQVDAELDELETAAKDKKRQRTAYAELLADTLDEEGATGVKLADFGPVSIRYKPYIHIGNPPLFRHHCVSVWIPDGTIHENELVLHAARAASLVTTLLERGEKLPPGVTAYMQKKLVKA